MERFETRNPEFFRRNFEAKRNPEKARLRAELGRIIGAPVGDPGVPITGNDRLQQLAGIMDKEPQRDQFGQLRYLLTSGLAVELITGFDRYHKDIDLVIMEDAWAPRWEMIGTDNVTPGEYWADMSFDPKFLQQTAQEVALRKRSSSTVAVVHPAIIMVQKLSDAFGRLPRETDFQDACALIDYWREQGSPRDWLPIINTAIKALPESQRERTFDRLRDLV